MPQCKSDTGDVKFAPSSVQLVTDNCERENRGGNFSGSTGPPIRDGFKYPKKGPGAVLTAVLAF